MTNHYVLSNVNDNADANPNDIVFAIKDKELSVSVVTLSAKDNPKLSKLVRKRFERSVRWN